MLVVMYLTFVIGINIDEEDLFEIMKDFHERLAGKHFNEPYAISSFSNVSY